MQTLNFEYFLYLIYDFFVTLGLMIYDPSLRGGVYDWFSELWWWCLIISIPLFIGVVYFFIKTRDVWREMHERVYGKPANIIDEIKEDIQIAPKVRNEAWDKVVSLIGSDNPNDWKLAIIESDKMLETVVNTFSVPGDNMGDKMKNIEKSDFTTLEEAWQAHKVRNRIAHEHNFHLGQREARLAINNYEKVFREFDFI